MKSLNAEQIWTVTCDFSKSSLIFLIALNNKWLCQRRKRGSILGSLTLWCKAPKVRLFRARPNLTKKSIKNRGPNLPRHNRRLNWVILCKMLSETAISASNCIVHRIWGAGGIKKECFGNKDKMTANRQKEGVKQQKAKCLVNINPKRW